MTDFPKPLPHGAITEVTPGVCCVRGTFRMGLGIRVGRTMTVVDGGDGLVIFNAVRLDEASQAKLDELGEVKHLVKLSDSHGIDEPFYADRYKPTLWSLPGAKLDELAPGEWLAGEGPVKGGVVVPPMWRRFQKVSGLVLGDTLSRLTELSFENLVTGHGPPVIGGAEVRLRNAIRNASA